MGESTSTLAAALRDAAVTREVVLERGALAALPAVANRRAAGARWMVVSDAATWAAAGAEVQQRLEGAGANVGSPLVWRAQPRLKPRNAIAKELAERLRIDGAIPIAVGSGVINDLVKYAAELAGKPYVCVATAASMDGYAASGAALLQGNFKRTLACAPPLAVLADPDVLASAPARMTGWGYGDLAGKAVAGADWVLADALGEEAMNPGPFAMVQDNLSTWLAQPAGVRQRDRAALAGLMRGLVMAGLAMQAHGNSRPASGSDHQFAHLWEMEEVAVDGQPVSHGACVGIGCLSMLAAYDWLMHQDVQAIDPARLAARVPPTETLRAEIAASFPLSFMAANAETEAMAKTSAPERVERRLHLLKSRWREIAAELNRRLPQAATVRQWLDAVGGASDAPAIGVPRDKHARDHARARVIRRRFTGLDVLHDLGWLDRAVVELFAPGGFWFNEGRKT